MDKIDSADVRALPPPLSLLSYLVAGGAPRTPPLAGRPLRQLSSTLTCPNSGGWPGPLRPRQFSPDELKLHKLCIVLLLLTTLLFLIAVILLSLLAFYVLFILLPFDVVFHKLLLVLSIQVLLLLPQVLLLLAVDGLQLLRLDLILCGTFGTLDFRLIGLAVSKVFLALRLTHGDIFLIFARASA